MEGLMSFPYSTKKLSFFICLYSVSSFWGALYWFWRLDFQIWLKRKELFLMGDDATPQNNDIRRAIYVAEKYVFKRNRSIEHIAPQTPLQEDTLKLEKEDRNCFGNLAMISSEQNSALSNSIYQEKRARVESFLDSSRSGSIESLKMLHAFTFNKSWSLEAIKEHGDTMYKKSWGNGVDNLKSVYFMCLFYLKSVYLYT